MIILELFWIWDCTMLAEVCQFLLVNLQNVLKQYVFDV